ncbi:MAG: rhodanese-like domain-containing protein [Leucothrix sp.]
MKSAQYFLDVANETVPTLSAKDAVSLHGTDAVFVDVRDSSQVTETGTIAGAQRIPRGFLEFAADAATPFHNPAMQKEANIYLICAAGGQAALSGKTLQEMGYQSVTNIGGIGDWKDAGGPMES